MASHEHVRTLRFRSGGVDVAAHVRLPAGPPPYPGVVLADGSGPGTRHDLRSFEDPFAGAGLAVLCHDKPGCGETAGDYTAQDLAGRAADTTAALAALRSQPDVDPSRTGLCGGSQGGWVVPAVAARVPVAFAVVLSAPSVSPHEQEAFSLEQRMREACEAEADVAAALTYYHQRWERLRRGDAPTDVATEQDALQAPWLPYVTHDGQMDAAALGFLARIGDHDPLPDLRRVTCPLLAVWGERDPLVPVARSVAGYHEALRHNPDVRLEVVPGADHGLRVPDPARPGERVRVAGVLERMAAWAASRGGAAAPGGYDPAP